MRQPIIKKSSAKFFTTAAERAVLRVISLTPELRLKKEAQRARLHKFINAPVKHSLICGAGSAALIFAYFQGGPRYDSSMRDVAVHVDQFTAIGMTLIFFGILTGLFYHIFSRKFALQAAQIDRDLQNGTTHRPGLGNFFKLLLVLGTPLVILLVYLPDDYKPILHVLAHSTCMIFVLILAYVHKPDIPRP